LGVLLLREGGESEGKGKGRRTERREGDGKEGGKPPTKLSHPLVGVFLEICLPMASTTDA